MAADRRDGTSVCLPPRPPKRRLDRPLPDGSSDCHFHVFADGAPLASPRNYTPRMLTLDDWSAFARFFGISRGVLVQPSVYGEDNGVLLAALAAMPDRLRGVVVPNPGVSDDALRALHGAGVRGIRFNTFNLGGLSLDMVGAFARRVAPLGWHLQFHARSSELGRIAEIAAGLPVPIVIDHFGLLPMADDEAREAGVEDLLRLLEGGRCYIKISATYRVGGRARRAAIADVAERLVAARPDRLLWGSDWPHTDLWDEMPDDRDLIEEAVSWLDDDATRRHVFVSNPAELYWST